MKPLSLQISHGVCQYIVWMLIEGRVWLFTRSVHCPALALKRRLVAGTRLKREFRYVFRNRKWSNMEIKSGFCYIDAVAITIELFNRS